MCCIHRLPRHSRHSHVEDVYAGANTYMYYVSQPNETYQSIDLSVCFFLCRSLSVSLRLSPSLSVSLSLSHLFLSVRLCLSIHLSLTFLVFHLFIYLSVCLCICLSLSVHLSICLSTLHYTSVSVWCTDRWMDGRMDGWM